jgi:hypothetical protein
MHTSPTYIELGGSVVRRGDDEFITTSVAFTQDGARMGMSPRANGEQHPEEHRQAEHTAGNERDM